MHFIILQAPVESLAEYLLCDTTKHDQISEVACLEALAD